MEVSAGVVIVVAAWMLDPAVCSGMELGTPRVTMEALGNLHFLLIERDFRRCFQDESHIVLEQRDDQDTLTDHAFGAASAEHRVRSEWTGGDGPIGARENPGASRRPPDPSRRRRGAGAGVLQ